MKYVIGILLAFITVTAFAQAPEKPLVQFSGVIHNADSAIIIVPYVSITNKSFKNQVTVANYEGYFSIVVHEQDTLTFTCVGYAPISIVIPSDRAKKSYTLQVLMKPIIINLPMFRVFPWATTEEFKKDFLTMKIADDDLEIARKNLNLTSILNSVRTMPLDGSEPLNVQQIHNNQMNSHSITNPLLNPFAWGALVQQIADGDKSRAGGN